MNEQEPDVGLEKRETRKPDMLASSKKKGRDGKTYYNNVGIGFTHDDGKGCDIYLDSVPVDGKITLRALRQSKMQEYQEQTHSDKDAPERGAAHQERGRGD